MECIRERVCDEKRSGMTDCLTVLKVGYSSYNFFAGINAQRIQGSVCEIFASYVLIDFNRITCRYCWGILNISGNSETSSRILGLLVKITGLCQVPIICATAIASVRWAYYKRRLRHIYSGMKWCVKWRRVPIHKHHLSCNYPASIYYDRRMSAWRQSRKKEELSLSTIEIEGWVLADIH